MLVAAVAVPLIALIGACGRIGFERSLDDASDAITQDGSVDAPIGNRTTTLVASNADPDDLFGCSVAISTDGNTLAVGAYGEASNADGVNADAADDSAPGAGAVYIFVREGGAWTQQAYVKTSNSSQADAFGVVIALSRDGNTLAVGAPDEDSSATRIDGDQTDDTADSAGAAYVFVRNGTTWSQQAYVKASNAEAGDNFGNAVALSTDGNTLAVAAFTEDGGAIPGNGAIDAGAVYVFTRSATTWMPEAYVKAPNVEANDNFGTDVSLSGDGNVLAVSATAEAGGGFGVGADQNDNSAVQAGAVYTFTRNGTTWSPELYIKASNTDAGDFFGYAIALSEGGVALAVTAEGEDSDGRGVDATQAEGAGQAGAVYVFDRSTRQQAAYIKATNTNEDDRFGRSVALAPDGDTLVVGAVLEDSAATGRDGDQSDNGAMNSGAGYSYRRTATWSAATYFKPPATGLDDQYGYSVAVSATGVIAIGAWQDDGMNEGASNSGAVHVYE